MKKFKIAVVSLALSAIMTFPALAITAGTFSGNGNNLTFRYDNGEYASGWVETSGSWYYFDTQTHIARTGWINTTDEKWYYINPETATVSYGWTEVNGNWYYLDKNTGELWGAAITPDGYEINQYGMLITHD